MTSGSSVPRVAPIEPAEPVTRDMEVITELLSRTYAEHQALHLQRSIASVRDSMIAVPETARGPLMVSAAGQYLAASVLYAFPNSAITDATVEHRRDAHPATLRRAVAFIDEHAHEDISIADVAATAFVSIRGLQLAFRRHLDSTPLAYLRRVRQAHAHRQLRAADPARETVTAVAYRWGFSNPSRFTAYYRPAYGTVPGQTLYK